MSRIEHRSRHARRWIRATAVAGGAVIAVAGALPSSPARAATTPIKHVVVLYLENHSFDNVLGNWCVQTGRCLGMPPTVTLKGGTVVTPTTTPDSVPQLNHLVRDQVAAMDGGKMDGWAAIGGCKPTQKYACVSGYQPSEIPNEIALVNKFGVNDHTFSMADSPSWGGHVYAVMATTDGFTGDNPIPASGVKPGNGWGCDSNKVTPFVQPGGTTVLAPSCIPDPALNNGTTIKNGGAFEPTPASYAPTIMDRLNTAGLSWRIYGSHNGQHGYNWATCPSIAECLDTPSQYANEVNSEQFVTDAKAGNLPAFSLIVPGDKTTGSSQHNGTSMLKGDNWLGQIASAVQKGPEWSSTALFITYDDFGGFYDSVVPGTNPDGTQQGPRVPLVIVSPYAIPAHTDSTPATFVSILAYTEQTFGLTALSANDTGAYAFANAFNYSQVPLAPVAMRQNPLPASAALLPPLDPNDPT